MKFATRNREDGHVTTPPEQAVPEVIHVSAKRRLLPGLVMVAIGTVLSLAVSYLATRLGVGAVSPLIVALILGAVVGSTWRVPVPAREGIMWSAKPLLRMGIVLLGLGLSLTQLLDIGWGGALVIVVTVTCTFVGTLALGRLMGVAPRTRLYVATGFSICGAAAIAAMEGAMSGLDEARSRVAGEGSASEHPDDVSALGTALALVTAYGSLMIAIMPWLASLLGLRDDQAGLWIGASVHEVAQVVAAAGIVSTSALAIATVVKLGRVVLLAPVVTIVSIITSRGHKADLASLGHDGKVASKTPVVPLFVLGFLGAVLVRTTGILPDQALSAGAELSKIMLTAAMFGLGTTIDIGHLVRTGRPALALGAIATTIVVGVSLVGVLLLG